MIEIDARGYECPRPVLELKNALEKVTEGAVKICVDNVAARENIKRFSNAMGYDIKIVYGKNDNEICITVYKGEKEKPDRPQNFNMVGNKVMYITDDKIGSDEELGQVLMKSFISTIIEADQYPEKIIFVNRGVHITCSWEDSIEDLKKLEKKGVKIFSCGTCLSYYNIVEKLQVGVIGNAYDTINSLLDAESVIRLA